MSGKRGLKSSTVWKEGTLIQHCLERGDSNPALSGKRGLKSSTVWKERTLIHRNLVRIDSNPAAEPIKWKTPVPSHTSCVNLAVRTIFFKERRKGLFFNWHSNPSGPFVFSVDFACPNFAAVKFFWESSYSQSNLYAVKYSRKGSQVPRSSRPRQSSNCG